jgi:hypothetical protein
LFVSFLSGHDLFNRRIEARQKHSGNNEDSVIAIAAFESVSPNVLKAVNDFFVLVSFVYCFRC